MRGRDRGERCAGTQKKNGGVEIAIILPIVVANEGLEALVAGTLKDELHNGSHRVVLANHAGQEPGVYGVMAQWARAGHFVVPPLGSGHLDLDHPDKDSALGQSKSPGADAIRGRASARGGARLVAR